MRQNNTNNMTITEQLVKIKNETCVYSCKYLQEVYLEEEDVQLRIVKMQGYCHDCPLSRLHFERKI